MERIQVQQKRKKSDGPFYWYFIGDLLIFRNPRRSRLRLSPRLFKLAVKTALERGKGASMNHASIVRQYLRERRGEELVAESFPFVTISRQAGAGGHALAREILRRLEKRHPGEFSEEWEVFDHKLCLLIAEDEKLGISFDRLLSEEYHSEVEEVVSDLLAQRSQRYAVYKRIFEIVRILATLGKCVIVGRGGMCVTGDMPLGVHIRLVAGEEVRVKRMMKLLEVGEAEAHRALREQDKSRHRMVKDFFGRDIDDPLLYDAVFNTERLAISEVADLAVELIEQKQARFQSALRKRS